MDVTSQVDSIVNNLVRDIETRLNVRVENVVNQYLDQKLESFDYEKKLNWLASVKLDGMIANLDLDKTSIQQRLDEVADTVIQATDAECRRTALEMIRTRLYGQVDINQIVRELVINEIGGRLDKMEFPVQSIPGTAINPTGLNLTGNNIRGGTVQEFNSTGIEDKSSSVQMTILDQGVVIENRVVSLGLEVHGTTTLKGDIVLEGNVSPDSAFYTSIISTAVDGVHNSMDAEFFSRYSNVLFDNIREHGLDLNRITLNGTEIVKGNQLNYGISDTNITRLGQVLDLQTRGETYLSEHLYVGKNKVGIGTIEPANSLTIWDQEIELGFGKRLKDVGWIGTPRRQDLVISANGQDNLTLTADGGVVVKKLTVNKVDIISAPSVPNNDMPKGTVAFNENPAVGQPIGWVSLGGGAWTRFGVIG